MRILTIYNLETGSRILIKLEEANPIELILSPTFTLVNGHWSWTPQKILKIYDITVDTLSQGPDYAEDDSIEEREEPITVQDTTDHDDDTANIAGYYPDHVDHQPRHEEGWLAGLDPLNGQDITEE